MMSNEVTTSSGNVFADLDLPASEMDLAKAELARRIAGIVAKKRLTQAQAAKTLGIDQPKVSALLRGRLRGFSTDRLLGFLNALGLDVQIVVKPQAKSKAHIRVVSA